MSVKRFTFQVPVWAAAHRSPLVKLAIDLAVLIFNNRSQLRRPLRDRWGNLLYDKLHMFLMRSAPRPPRKDGRAYTSKETLEGRRADHFQKYLAFWVTCIGLADHDTWELREPTHERAQERPYPSLARIAELAELNCSSATVERIRKEMANAEFITFTKQSRAERNDGKGFYSSGGAFRRMGRKALAAIGGFFGLAVVARIDEAEAKVEERKRKERTFSDRVDEMYETKRRIAALNESRASVEPSQPSYYSAEEEAQIAEVRATHPNWAFPRIYREAKRRLAQIAAGLAPGPEPNTS